MIHPMASHHDPRQTVPSLRDTVPILHRQLEAQARRVTELARVLPHASMTAVRRDLHRLVETLDRHLLPYIEVEEQALREGSGLDPFVALEHRAIQRAVHDLRGLAAESTIDVNASQAALAQLAVNLVDHLRHERTAYLPNLH